MHDKQLMMQFLEQAGQTVQEAFLSAAKRFSQLGANQDILNTPGAHSRQQHIAFKAALREMDDGELTKPDANRLKLLIKQWRDELVGNLASWSMQHSIGSSLPVSCEGHRHGRTRTLSQPWLHA